MPRINRSQFANIEYRYNDASPVEKQVLARNTDTDRIVGHLGIDAHLSKGTPKDPTPGGRGLGVGLVYTDPSIRGQGVASAMYNIASRELGYQPMHDEVRTKEGDKFAKNVGGPMSPKDPGKPVMASWEIPDGGDEMQTIQQPRWERGKPVDRTVAHALTPVKPKQRRKRKADGVQEMLPGTEDY